MKQVRELSGCRKRCKLSQEAVAEKLGVSRQTLSRWERGETEIPAQYLPKLAELYGVSINELLEEIYGVTDKASVAASTETPEKPDEPTAPTPVSTAQKLPLRYKIALCSAVALCVLFAVLFTVNKLKHEKENTEHDTLVTQDELDTKQFEFNTATEFDMSSQEE